MIRSAWLEGVIAVASLLGGANESAAEPGATSVSENLVLIVVNTEGTPAGTRDVDRVVQMFERTSGAIKANDWPRVTFFPTIRHDGEITEETLLKLIDEAPVADRTTLVGYFRMPHASSGEERLLCGPTIASRSVSRRRLFNELLKRNARLTVFISESGTSCPLQAAGKASSIEGIPPELFSDLFARPCGAVDVKASTFPSNSDRSFELSWADADGGLLTRALLNTLAASPHVMQSTLLRRIDRDSNVEYTWKEVEEVVIGEVEASFEVFRERAKRTFIETHHAAQDLVRLSAIINQQRQTPLVVIHNRVADLHSKTVD